MLSIKIPDWSYLLCGRAVSHSTRPGRDVKSIRLLDHGSNDNFNRHDVPIQKRRGLVHVGVTWLRCCNIDIHDDHTSSSSLAVVGQCTESAITDNFCVASGCNFCQKKRVNLLKKSKLGWGCRTPVSHSEIVCSGYI